MSVCLSSSLVAPYPPHPTPFLTASSSPQKVFTSVCHVRDLMALQKFRAKTTAWTKQRALSEQIISTGLFDVLVTISI